MTSKQIQATAMKNATRNHDKPAKTQQKQWKNQQKKEHNNKNQAKTMKKPAKASKKQTNTMKNQSKPSKRQRKTRKPLGKPNPTKIPQTKKDKYPQIIKNPFFRGQESTWGVDPATAPSFDFFQAFLHRSCLVWQ